MPAPFTPLVPMLMGSVAARGAQKLYNWADTRYISMKPEPMPQSESAPTAMKRRFRGRRRPLRRIKRRRRGIIRRRVPRTLVPRSKVITARIVEGYTGSCAAGAIEVRFLNVMDIPDPTSGHGAQQILGYDQMKLLWKKAVVLGLRTTLRVHNKSTVGCMFGITAMPENQGNTTLTTYDHYMEMPQTKALLLSPEVDHSIITYTVSTRKHLHLQSLKDESDFHSVLATESGPTRTFWMNYWVQPVDKTTNGPFEVVATHDFLIRLFDPIVLARSTDS